MGDAEGLLFLVAVEKWMLNCLPVIHVVKAGGRELERPDKINCFVLSGGNIWNLLSKRRDWHPSLELMAEGQGGSKPARVEQTTAKGWKIRVKGKQPTPQGVIWMQPARKRRGGKSTPPHPAFNRL